MVLVTHGHPLQQLLHVALNVRLREEQLLVVHHVLQVERAVLQHQVQRVAREKHVQQRHHVGAGKALQVVHFAQRREVQALVRVHGLAALDGHAQAVTAAHCVVYHSESTRAQLALPLVLVRDLCSRDDRHPAHSSLCPHWVPWESVLTATSCCSTAVQ